MDDARVEEATAAAARAGGGNDGGQTAWVAAREAAREAVGATVAEVMVTVGVAAARAAVHTRFLSIPVGKESTKKASEGTLESERATLHVVYTVASARP